MKKRIENKENKLSKSERRAKQAKRRGKERKNKKRNNNEREWKGNKTRIRTGVIDPDGTGSRVFVQILDYTS